MCLENEVAKEFYNRTGYAVVRKYKNSKGITLYHGIYRVTHPIKKGVRAKARYIEAVNDFGIIRKPLLKSTLKSGNIPYAGFHGFKQIKDARRALRSQNIVNFRVDVVIVKCEFEDVFAEGYFLEYHGSRDAFRAIYRKILHEVE